PRDESSDSDSEPEAEEADDEPEAEEANDELEVEEAGVEPEAEGADVELEAEEPDVCHIHERIHGKHEQWGCGAGGSGGASGSGGAGGSGGNANGTGVRGTGPTVYVNGLRNWNRCSKSTSAKKKDRVKFAMATLQGRAITWWNGRTKAMGIEAANNTPWSEVKKWMTE
nr:putative reverse transcriptase domain-containing protein [Tanacetum cinerariifolium]